MTDLAEVAAALGRRLHDAGLAVTPQQAGRFAAATVLVAPATTDELYWTARTTLVSDHAGIEVLDRVFDDVFRGVPDVMVGRQHGVPTAVASRSARDGVDHHRETRSRGGTASATGDADADTHDDDALVAAASELERLARTPFDECTPDELSLLRRLVTELVERPPERPSRRTTRHPQGDVVDLRSTLRAARRTGGDPVRHVRRRTGVRRRKVVLLADVSGSMAAFSRSFLLVLHGAVRAWHAEAFVFATRLTRVTRPLSGRQPELALRTAATGAPDWAGGTRIGDALQSFNDGWGRRGLARGAVVVIVSDGWEAGDPALLGREMRRLALLAHRVVWVNPRRRSELFRPSTAGMQAALPHVDALVSGHSLEAVTDLLGALRD